MKTFTPHPIALGPLEPKDIVITVSPSNLEVTEDVSNRIEELWREKEQEAKNKGLNFFNGVSYRVNSYNFTNGKLVLDLATFEFKLRYGLITMSRLGEIDPTVIVQGGCFVGATVVTSDKKYLLVKQSGKSALNINIYDVLGGMAEIDVPLSGGDYFHQVLFNELKEEGNIFQSDIDSCSLKMVYAAQNGHFGFYFEVTLNVTATELLERHQYNSDVDIESLHAYSKAEYLKNLQNHPSPNKQLLAKCFMNQL
jgi:hypothetical protein